MFSDTDFQIEDRSEGIPFFLLTFVFYLCIILPIVYYFIIKKFCFRWCDDFDAAINEMTPAQLDNFYQVMAEQRLQDMRWEAINRLK